MSTYKDVDMRHMSTYQDVDMMYSYVGTTHLYVLHLNMYYIFICTHVMSSYKDVDMTRHL